MFIIVFLIYRMMPEIYVTNIGRYCRYCKYIKKY